VQLTVLRARPRVIPVRIITEDNEHVLNIEDDFDWSKIRKGVRGYIIIGEVIEFTDKELSNRKLIGKRIRKEVMALHP